MKAHRGKVMQKMQADSLADLVRMAARIPPAPAATTAAVAEEGNRGAAQQSQAERRWFRDRTCRESEVQFPAIVRPVVDRSVRIEVQFLTVQGAGVDGMIHDAFIIN